MMALVSTGVSWCTCITASPLSRGLLSVVRSADFVLFSPKRERSDEQVVTGRVQI